MRLPAFITRTTFKSGESNGTECGSGFIEVLPGDVKSHTVALHCQGIGLLTPVPVEAIDAMYQAGEIVLTIAENKKGTSRKEYKVVLMGAQAMSPAQPAQES
jgi:hypothetical protein